MRLQCLQGHVHARHGAQALEQTRTRGLIYSATKQKTRNYAPGMMFCIPLAPALAHRCASSLMVSEMGVSDGLAPSKMHALRCFQSHRAHGGRRVVVGRALPSLEGRVGVGEVDCRASPTEDLMPNLAYLLLSISSCGALYMFKFSCCYVHR